MAYIDGFVIPVPTANRRQFIEHATSTDSMFRQLGALRILECWADDVPDGTFMDFRKAVAAKDDETVVFSWVEWPDKATRDEAMRRMHELFESDSRFDPEKHPVPFDGRRMIFGGFTPVVEL